jgi:cell division protein FtsI/penicillin-binding protein 2
MRRRWPVLLLTLAVFAGLALEAPAARSKRRSRSPRVTRRARPPRPPAPPSLVSPVSASSDDLAVGEACRRGLQGVHGGAVAMDPHTGRVLAVVNPSVAVSNAYQPCSVFKIVVAVAGLTEGVVTPETVYNCSGGCWLWPGHGPVNLRRALASSCNPYFEWIGERLGYTKVQHYAQMMGLGGPSGINLADEASGRLPLFVTSSRVGHLSSHAAGVSTSAVQLAVLLSATINGGIVYQPQVSGPHGFIPKERWRLPRQTVVGGLSDGFLSAVNEGSAATAFDPEVIVAGKTGTCAGLGWFASYAPADAPRVVIVVFVRPGSGHLASTVAGRIYQHLYRDTAHTAVAAGG